MKDKDPVIKLLEEAQLLLSINMVVCGLVFLFEVVVIVLEVVK